MVRILLCKQCDHSIEATTRGLRSGARQGLWGWGDGDVRQAPGRLRFSCAVQIPQAALVRSRVSQRQTFLEQNINLQTMGRSASSDDACSRSTEGMHAYR